MKEIETFDFVTSKWKKELVEATPYCRPYPVRVTPVQADILLRKNHNRVIRPNKVSQVARDLENNEFDISNDIVSFSEDRCLLNGQHRLSAIKMSGKPAIVFVGYGFSKRQQSKMDGGAKRILHDVAVLDGCSVSKSMDSIARFVRCTTMTGLPLRATRPEQINFIKEYKEELEYAKNILEPTTIPKNDRTNFKIGNDIGSAFFRALTYFKNNEPKRKEVERFIEALLSYEANNKLSLLASDSKASIEEQNKGLLLRQYTEFIEDSKKLRRSGQDQGGRTFKYLMTEKFISEFVSPRSTLIQRNLSRRNLKELFRFSIEFS